MWMKATCTVAIGVWLPATVFAFHASSIPVRSLDGTTSFKLTGYDEAGGVNLAVADLGEDGVAEILVAGGLGSEPRVHVVRQDGSEIGSFLAYAPTMGVGVNVVACDLTGDGVNEIVVAPQRGGGPHVRVFSNIGEAIDGGGFFAYDAMMRVGVNLTCGNLLGDARAELVTLPAAGGGAHVRVWSWSDSRATLEKNFFAFHASDRFGLVGVVHEAQLHLAQQFTSTPTLKTIVIHSSPTVVEEKKISLDALGVRALVILDDDVMLVTQGNGALLNTRTGSAQPLVDNGASVSVASDSHQLIYAPAASLFTSSREPKRIEVDISSQRLFAYEAGILTNSFLIASGKNNATPLGNHVILAKVPTVHYTWTYGVGDPRNYDLGLVPYNLRFFPHIYIHYAYWHNNFGHPMSRGCVNVALEDMKWVYAWGEVGVPVMVKE